MAIRLETVLTHRALWFRAVFANSALRVSKAVWEFAAFARVGWEYARSDCWRLAGSSNGNTCYGYTFDTCHGRLEVTKRNWRLAFKAQGIITPNRLWTPSHDLIKRHVSHITATPKVSMALNSPNDLDHRTCTPISYRSLPGNQHAYLTWLRMAVGCHIDSEGGTPRIIHFLTLSATCGQLSKSRAECCAAINS